MGADGQQPYFSSSGYLQDPVSYGSEAMPHYSWNSTYVGDTRNGTSTFRGSVRSVGGPNVSVNSNGFNKPIRKHNFIDSKTSTFPLDIKSRQSTAPANIAKSKTIIPALPRKPLNKLGSGFQSSGLVQGFQPVGKFSSYNNQNQGLFGHNSPMNHRPNHSVWNDNDRYKMREKSSRSGEFEASTELTRGPRVHNRSNPLNPSVEDEQLGLSIRKDQYNLPDFKTEYDNAKFFVIKSYSEDDVHKCIKYGVWSSTPNGNKKLDIAFHDAEAKASETGPKCPIFLFFSVNGSGQFVGLAEMIGRLDFDKNMDFWQLDKWNGFFPVKWHIIKDIPNSQLRHIILENNDNRPVTYTRDTQEIGLKQGLEMLNIFKNYLGKTSVLDDFNFYENREKLLKSKKCVTPALETELYKNNDSSLKHIKGEIITKDGAGITNSSDATSSLVNLTRNLSIHSHPLKNSGNTNATDNTMPAISAAVAL